MDNRIVIPAQARIHFDGMNRVHCLQVKPGTWFTAWIRDVATAHVHLDSHDATLHIHRTQLDRFPAKAPQQSVRIAPPVVRGVCSRTQIIDIHRRRIVIPAHAGIHFDVDGHNMETWL